jgi:hypothetical protein
MKDKAVWIIFWALVAVFVILVGAMFVLVPLAGSFPLGYIVFPAGAVFLGLGVALLVLTVKKKVEGVLRKFLLLTGAAAVGLPVFAVLHNLVYALFIKLFGADFWGSMGDEPVFFILATMVCPIAFLVGIVGTIVLAVKNKSAVPTATS